MSKEKESGEAWLRRYELLAKEAAAEAETREKTAYLLAREAGELDEETTTEEFRGDISPERQDRIRGKLDDLAMDAYSDSVAADGYRMIAEGINIVTCGTKISESSAARAKTAAREANLLRERIEGYAINPLLTVRFDDE